jgi:quinol monooxygenase YgiN
MQLFFFARFHVREGCGTTAEETLRNVLDPTRTEPGCISIRAFRSTRDPRLFYIHSCWADEAAFEVHSGLPHTKYFIEQMESLIDQPLDFARTELIG